MKKRKTPKGDGNIVALVCLKQCGEVHEQNKTPEGDGNSSMANNPFKAYFLAYEQNKNPTRGR